MKRWGTFKPINISVMTRVIAKSFATAIFLSDNFRLE